MAQKPPLRIAILGSAGVPARYGGFETLAENLIRLHEADQRTEVMSVYCGRPTPSDRPATLHGACLRYSRFRANGASSVIYDATTLHDACARGVDVALLLGVSGALALPFLRRRGAKIVTHVDGVEWRRAKWSAPARAFLRWSEGVAVRHSDAVIADSVAIAEQLRANHGVGAEVITYGGDHAVTAPVAPLPEGLPQGYTLALCRIEPENNIAMILEAAARTKTPLVSVGNWHSSPYGRKLRARYGQIAHMRLLDAVYDPGPLLALRRGAARYIHGHSAGGTNPALVEMMHVGTPILAFDCIYNRETTRNQASYFSDATSLGALMARPARPTPQLAQIAREHYTWDRIGAQYFDLFETLANAPAKRPARKGLWRQFPSPTAS